MSIKIVTQAKVLNKFANDGVNKTSGEKVTWYNLKLVDEETYDSQIVGVPKEVYDSIEEGDKVQLGGEVGGLKTTYWKFDKFIGKVK